jgi:hypothetical protein
VHGDVGRVWTDDKHNLWASLHWLQDEEPCWVKTKAGQRVALETLEPH